MNISIITIYINTSFSPVVVQLFNTMVSESFFKITFFQMRIILYLYICGIQIEQKKKRKQNTNTKKKKRKLKFFIFPLFCFVCVYHTGTREHKR
jgi:membrane-anchored glycerophosphoryl diester phosphodiesterase (GDPDase)